MTDVSERLSAALADRYRIERELGQGGMATVFLAEDLRHHRKVAIKVLKPDLAAVLGAERFVQEITTTAQLSHPHILPLFDSGEDGGFLYYVMPFVEGETIRTRLNRETQLGIEDAVRITTEVADALDYAHRHGVIHRDIKPENILLHDGRAMVMDFGIALAVSAAAGGRMTETGLSLGTPHYMSPEQATADREITGRSDIYSLASVLYEMLSGEPPHMGTSAQQIIMKIVADVPRPVTELRKSVPPNVAAAVSKALEKLPADRFTTAREFSDALQGRAVPGTVATYSAPSAPASMARVARHPLVLGLAAALVAALGFGAMQYSAAHREAPGQTVRFHIDMPWTVHVGNMPNGTNVAVSPDGRMIAYASDAGSTDTPGPAGSTCSGWTSWMHTPSPGPTAAVFPHLSPDGDWIAFQSGGKVWKVPVRGGSPDPGRGLRLVFIRRSHGVPRA